MAFIRSLTLVITMLGVGSAVVAGLIYVPWPGLLILLGAGLLWTTYLLRDLTALEATTPKASDLGAGDMSLQFEEPQGSRSTRCYRGVSYKNLEN